MNRQYIGARYVPKFDGAWSSEKVYEALTVVEYNNSSYTSKKPVPVGTLPTNTEYWALSGTTSGQILDLQERLSTTEGKVNLVDERVETLETDLEPIKNKKYIFIGDSYGVPVADSGDIVTTSYIDMLLDVFDGVKLAENGAGFVSYFNRTFLSMLQEANLENKDSYTDIVVVGGVNDAGDSTKPISGDTISNAIISFCDYCKNNYPNAKIHIGMIGAITPAMNIKERALNLYDTVLFAYSNTNAEYDFMPFSPSVLYDRSLIKTVHPTQAGQIEIFKYINRYLHGNASVHRKWSATVNFVNHGNYGFHGDITNGVVNSSGLAVQISLGNLSYPQPYNLGGGVEVGDIPANSVLATPKKSGYVGYVIPCSLLVMGGSGTYCGYAWLIPNENGTKLRLQITHPSSAGGQQTPITGTFYIQPLPCTIQMYNE